MGIVARAWIAPAPGAAPMHDTGDMRAVDLIAVDEAPTGTLFFCASAKLSVYGTLPAVPGADGASPDRTTYWGGVKKNEPFVTALVVGRLSSTDVS